MVRVYNGILLSHKRDAFESVLMRWMNLEPTIQKEKSKYLALIHICGV